MINSKNYVWPQGTEQDRIKLEAHLPSLVGSPIRVLTDSIPRDHVDDSIIDHALTKKGFVFPDGYRLDGIPFFVEGVLRDFRIDVAREEVDLILIPHPFTDRIWRSAPFRESRAIIITTQALISLEFTLRHYIELLPARWESYWEDFRSPNYQFEFEFVDLQPSGFELPLL